MKKTVILVIVCLMVSAMFISCNKETSKDDSNSEFITASKEVGETFLTSLYTTSDEEMLEFSSFALGHEGAFDKYVVYLENLYSGVLAQDLSHKLAAERSLDIITQYAYIHETSFNVESVELSIFDEDEADVVYEYIVKVRDKNSDIVREIFGQIRIENIDGDYLITASDLDNTSVLQKAYRN